MNEDFNKKISYSDLRQIIFDYFKKNKDIELNSTSIDYFKEKLTNNYDPRPFFIINNEFGETRFDISKEDIKKIYNSYLLSDGYELLSIEYGNDVKVKYKQNSKINRSKEEKVELDITYNGKMNYNDLRQIIINYYKENKGIQLITTSIDYLKSKLTDGKYNQPFFFKKDEFGETEFNISQEKIKQILREYLAKENYELINLTFNNSVEFKYKQGKQQEREVEQEKTGLDVRINESGEINRDDFIPTLEHLVAEDVSHFEPPKYERRDTLDQTNKSKESELMPVTVENLERMAREKRKYTILQRERAMSEAQKGKTRSAVIAGLCILSTTVAVHFNGQDIQQIIQQQLNAIYSWEALIQYFKDIGPLTTLLTAGTVLFAERYLNYSKKLKQIQNEFIDFNNSLEDVNAIELGGNENAKSR